MIAILSPKRILAKRRERLRPKRTDEFFKEDSPHIFKNRFQIMEEFKRINKVDFDVYDKSHRYTLSRVFPLLKMQYIEIAVSDFRKKNIEPLKEELEEARCELRKTRTKLEEQRQAAENLSESLHRCQEALSNASQLVTSTKLLS